MTVCVFRRGSQTCPFLARQKKPVSFFPPTNLVKGNCELVDVRAMKAYEK